jgi:hypothetical protein
MQPFSNYVFQLSGFCELRIYVTLANHGPESESELIYDWGLPPFSLSVLYIVGWIAEKTQYPIPVVYATAMQICPSITATISDH